MEDIRRYHNEEKRALITRFVREGDSVLDVGCGFGGDFKNGATRASIKYVRTG